MQKYWVPPSAAPIVQKMHSVVRLEESGGWVLFGVFRGGPGAEIAKLGGREDLGECINGPEGCRGTVEHRMPLSGTGQSFSRCDWHWEQRLENEQGIRERYPEHAPADWSPSDAGEAWEREDLTRAA